MQPSLNVKLELAGSLFGGKPAYSHPSSVSVSGSGGSAPGTMAGGSIHSGEKDGWYWEKWDNGKYVCWKDVTLSITGWNQWGSVYEGAQYIESQGYPFEFYGVPAFEAKSIGGNSTGAYIAGFEVGPQGTASKSPAVTVLRGTSIDITGFTVRIQAEGFWKEPDYADINGGGSSSGGGAGDGSLTESDLEEIAKEVAKLLSGAGGSAESSAVLGEAVLGKMALGSEGGSGTTGGSGSLPSVTAADDGKVLTVVGGSWAAANLPKYSGSYSVTPTPDAQTLPTAGRYMDDDVTVKSIPFYETSNTSGGSTIYIASEVDS